MKPSEKLEEIKNKYDFYYGEGNSETDNIADQDTTWLILRAEKLTEIIMQSKHKRSSDPMREHCSDTCYACWARKTLDEGGAE